MVYDCFTLFFLENQSAWGSPKMGLPLLLKWMIWGYHHFGKPAYGETAENTETYSNSIHVRFSFPKSAQKGVDVGEAETKDLGGSYFQEDTVKLGRLTIWCVDTF